MDIEFDPPITAEDLINAMGQLFPNELRLAGLELRNARLEGMLREERGEVPPELKVVEDDAESGD